MIGAYDVSAIVRDELAPIRLELKSIGSDLDDLREKVENVIGFQKENDYALERIAAIEKHLGIDKKIAAYVVSSHPPCFAP
jgi:hypothetical protein